MRVFYGKAKDNIDKLLVQDDNKDIGVAIKKELKNYAFCGIKAM